VDLQIGRGFPIFQDREDITWGQQWKSRIDGAIDTATFLIPIITPGFFRSAACREELERFLEREKQLAQTDLVLPIYYVECAELEDAGKRGSDPLAQAIHSHQRVEWRSLRHGSDRKVRRAITDLAKQIKKAISR
jgi:hypothetical protein